MEKITFIHIPRTGGTSLAYNFKKHFSKRMYHIYGESIKKLRVNDFKTDINFSKYDIVSGHLPIIGIKKLGLMDRRLISIVRDPIDQWLSFYNMIISIKPDVNFAMIYNYMNVYDLLEIFENDPYLLATTQIFLLTGEFKFNNKAKEMIDKYYHIGIHEKYNDFVFKMSEITNKKFNYKNFNKEEAINNFEYFLSEKDLNRIRKILEEKTFIKEQYKMYDYIKNKFHSDV